MNSFPHIQAFGEDALLLSWPKRIDRDIIREVREFRRRVEFFLYEMVHETVISYSEIVLYLRPGIKKEQVIAALKTLGTDEAYPGKTSQRHLIIPVCYAEEFAPDLKEIAKAKEMSTEEIIRIHTTAEYELCFIGFLPGFPYLTGLSEQLYMPRKQNPRLRIPAGSVAIGGYQTGIYPLESPGGWHIIGRTPVCLFDVHGSVPSILQAGDLIHFEAVSKVQFEHLMSGDRLPFHNKKTGE